ncbi:hypothetical protein A2311_01905 [candidate division WOR-1 bacterium RIFOXYB2_FULL_48_7]|uniref:Uncharacterized protein n=1 Tax=candidate division WOR-1 bacterium RIFOXYB2_FULL_48_7 TaxID=1802583 RepID=A0A1F4TLU0_UNCSA|nr:MAG: hypothetical protein A2311_01905 [candidate division WOR-1 bacterium RIFOXYB2_FULL_48_7]
MSGLPRVTRIFVAGPQGIRPFQLGNKLEKMGMTQRLRGGPRLYTAEMPMWRKLLDHPRFSLFNVGWRSLAVGIMSALFLGWMPGILPLLGLSSLIEARAGRKSVKIDVQA